MSFCVCHSAFDHHWAPLCKNNAPEMCVDIKTMS